MAYVDLGQEYKVGGPCCAPEPNGAMKKGEKRISYPTLYISGAKGLDLSTGEIEFRCKGRVVSVSERRDDGKDDRYSCEIEVHAISPESGDGAEGGLDEALEKIESTKSKK